jgi:hypothetical protein
VLLARGGGERRLERLEDHFLLDALLVGDGVDDHQDFLVHLDGDPRLGRVVRGRCARDAVPGLVDVDPQERPALAGTVFQLPEVEAQPLDDRAEQRGELIPQHDAPPLPARMGSNSDRITDDRNKKWARGPFPKTLKSPLKDPSCHLAPPRKVWLGVFSQPRIVRCGSA